jgi:hypothetical protein
LVAVGTVVSGQAPGYLPLRDPKVLTGADVGFRVDGMLGETPVGEVVIRVNGQWVEARVGKPGFANRATN